MQAKSSQKELGLAEAQLEILVPYLWNYVFPAEHTLQKKYLSTDTTVSKDFLLMETTRRKCRKVLLS